MKNRKKEVIFIFTAAFIFLFIGLFMYGLIFNYVAPYMFGKNYDKGALATMIGWSATLFIGYCGYILIDKWKDQEHKKIIRDNASNTLNYLGKFINIALSLSNKEELLVEEFKEYQETYYDAYLSLNILYKLTEDPEVFKSQKFLQDTYLSINNIRTLIISNQITFDVGKTEMRNFIISLGEVHKKCSYFMNIHNI